MSRTFYPFDIFELDRFKNDRIHGAVSAALSALTYDPSTYEMLGVRTGTGDVSIARASTRYAQDVNGLYFSVQALERAINGGRVVQNLVRYSEDLSNGVWGATGFTVTDLGGSSFTCTTTGTGSCSFQQTCDFNESLLGRHFILSVDLKDSTFTACSLRVMGYNSANGWVENAAIEDVQASINSTFNRFTVNGAFTDSSVEKAVFTLRRVSGAAGEVVTVKRPQLEESTGRVDLTTPSEYCPTDTIGAGDPSGYKVFANQNGNSVASNVVTEGVGAALAEVPWLSACPAATNSQIRSNDLADAEWTASNMTVGDQDETGIDELPTTACTLTATAANATLIANAITDASDDQATCWWVKRKTGTGNIDLTLDNGSTWTTVTLDGAFQKFTVDQAALANPQIGIRLVTDTDAVIVGNAECHLGKVESEVRGLGPIFTEGSAVSTEADAPSLDILNHNNSEVCYYCEWSPGYDYDEKSATEYIITTNTGASVLSDSATIGSIGTYQGTATSVTGLTYANNDVMKIGVIASAGDNEKNICVDGVWATAGTYSGYAVTTALKLMLSAFPMRMRNLQRFNISGSVAQKAKIDELMVTRLTADSFTDRLVDESGNFFTV